MGGPPRSADQNRLKEREQADHVDVFARSIDGSLAQVPPDEKGEPVHVVAVFNSSKRPVRELACKIEVIHGTDRSIQHQERADVYGELVAFQLGSTARGNIRPVKRASTMPVLRGGYIAAFIRSFTVAVYPELVPWVRFTDDAGSHWEISADLHLEKFAERDW